MTQAKVGTVQGFLEIPELLQPTQPGGLTRQTEARSRTGKGSWHFERSPVEAATRPLGWEGLQSHPAFLWCSWGEIEAQGVPSQDPDLSQTPPGGPHTPPPPILPCNTGLFNGHLPPTHTALGRSQHVGSSPHSDQRVFPPCEPDHVITQMQTFHGSLLSWGQSPGPPCGSQAHCHHCPPPFCIPATWNSFTSSHPTLSCLRAAPHPVTLVSLLYLADSSLSSALGVDISSSRKPSLTPWTC